MKKEPYEKPRLRTIDLVAEEVLAPRMQVGFGRDGAGIPNELHRQ